MKRLGCPERVLLATLLPLWILCFALHVREIGRTGVAEPPVFAVLPWGSPDAYPAVGGFRVEREQPQTGLRVGDRLLRIGGVDLRGRGYAGFDAVALEVSGTAGRAELEYERAAEVRRVELVMVPLPVPWVRVPWACMNVLAGLLVLLRAPRRPTSRLAFAAFVSFAMLETPFDGGPGWQTYAAHVVYDLGGAVAVSVVLRWFIAFPDEVRSEQRLSPLWAYLGGALFLAARSGYYLGGPLPVELTPRVTLAVDAAFGAGILVLLGCNYRHATPIGRRRMRWVIWGSYVLLVPYCGLLLCGSLGVGPPYHQMLTLLFGLAIVHPFTVLIAIVRYNLYDIDRLISATTAYTVGVSVLLAAALWCLPPAARALSTFFSSSQLSLAVLSLGLAGGVVWLSRELQPWIDRWLFPQRRAFELGVRQLLRDIGASGHPHETVRLAAERTTALLHTRRAALYLRDVDAGSYAPQALCHEADPRAWPQLDERDALVRLLELEARVLCTETRSSCSDRARHELTHGALGALGVQALIPFRCAGLPIGFFALGPKGSGDTYTEGDVALLAAVGEQASAVLDRLRSHTTLLRERDVAERLRTLKDAAERANLERSRFLAAASHDLRQPLSALNLLADSLGSRVREADTARLVEQLRGAAGSLTEMFDSLLDISRLDAGAVVPAVQPVPLAPLLEQVREQFAILAERKGIELRVAPTRAVVRSDRALLQRILQNLVHNAIRYTDKGRVLVGCRRHGERLSLEVLDTGIGIAADDIPRIFQAFLQVGERSGGERGGLGLGLSIVERSVRLLGHALEVRSVPGKGSRFSLLMSRTSALSEPATAPRGLDLAGQRILVLEDDARVREALAVLLGGWGCEVRAGGTLDEALCALADGAHVAALLVDYDLGAGSTALEAIPALQASAGRALPALVVSAERDARVTEAIRQAGWPCLSKPIAPAKLRALLGRLIQDARLQTIHDRSLTVIACSPRNPIGSRATTRPRGSARSAGDRG